MRIYRRRLRVAALALAFSTAAGGIAEEISVTAAVSSREIYRGEEIVYQVQIDGSDSPERPDTSSIKNFDVTYDSERANNSRTITTINGRRTEAVSTGYLINYRLVALHSGTTVIPPVTVEIEGTEYRTNQIQVLVKEPRETDDYKLRLELSSPECYVGETVTLKVTWYWARDKRATSLLSYSVPALSSPDFVNHPVQVAQSSNEKLLQLPIEGEDTIAVQGEGRLGGDTYTTVRLERVLIPQRAGVIDIPSATVVFEGVSGYESYRDFFGRTGRRETIAKYVIPSNSLGLVVRDVPAEGRPRRYSGLVGEYKMEASADPVTANVGDPITLTVRVSGTGYLEEFRLPPLDEISDISEDFKVPSERAAGKSQGASRVFTQTIRPKHANISSIPSFEIAYFDPKNRSYSTTRSDPIPLEVNETRIVTIRDVEGDEPVEDQAAIEVWGEGIGHNYEELDVIEHQAFGLETLLARPLRIAGLLLAPFAYFGLVLFRRFSRSRIVGAEERAARNAYRRFKSGLGSAPKHESLDAGTILDLLKNFLGTKCLLPSKSMTYADIAPELKKRGVPDDVSAELRAIFDDCEAGRYGGPAVGAEENLRDRALAVAKRIEEALR